MSTVRQADNQAIPQAASAWSYFEAISLHEAGPQRPLDRPGYPETIRKKDGANPSSAVRRRGTDRSPGITQNDLTNTAAIGSVLPGFDFDSPDYTAFDATRGD
jgi:hypothetical protein